MAAHDGCQCGHYRDAHRAGRTACLATMGGLCPCSKFVLAPEDSWGDAKAVEVIAPATIDTAPIDSLAPVVPIRNWPDRGER